MAKKTPTPKHAPWKMPTAEDNKKQRFSLLIARREMAVLKIVEKYTGARLSEQIRRAISASVQTLLAKARKSKPESPMDRELRETGHIFPSDWK